MKGGMIDQSSSDAAAFGLELDVPAQPEHFEVEPDAWEAMRMFLRCQTQWRTGPAGVIGLDYLALEAMLRLYGALDPGAMLEDIQIIEGEILAIAQKEAS